MKTIAQVFQNARMEGALHTSSSNINESVIVESVRFHLNIKKSKI